MKAKKIALTSLLAFLLIPLNGISSFKNVNALDNYQFIDNGDGTYKVIKTRVLNSNDEETTHKTLNLETHFVCETKVK